MTKTNTPNWDHNRRVAIKPQKIKLCDECCAYMTYSDKLRCISCRNTSYVIVYEHWAADFRRDVAAAHEELKDLFAWELAAAIEGVDATEAEVDAFLALTERPEYNSTFYLDTEPTDDDLRAIDAWLASEPVAVQQAAVYMEADPRDFGARVTISGGEVDEIPNTEFGSRAWFAGMPEEEIF